MFAKKSPAMACEDFLAVWPLANQANKGLRTKAASKRGVSLLFASGVMAALCFMQPSFAQSQPPKSRRSQSVHMQRPT